MKITIEIDHKTTQNDIDKLIGALQSVYAAPKKEKVDTPIRKEQVKLKREEIRGIEIPSPVEKVEAPVEKVEDPVSDSLFVVREYKTINQVFDELEKEDKVKRSKKWIYYLVREKKISSRKKHRKLYVSKKEIEEYYNSIE